MGLLTQIVREGSSHPAVLKAASGGGAFSAARTTYQAARLGFKATLGNNLGRIAIGAGIGAGLGYKTGDEYSSGNSRVNRAFAGAMFGGLAAAGFNVATSRTAGRTALYGAKQTGRLARRAAMAGGRGAIAGAGASTMRFGGFAEKILSVGSVAEGADILASTGINAINKGTKLAAMTAPVILGAGAAIGGSMAYSSAARQRRLARFQESASGVVQGAHAGRHG